jgi:hypothetical protein
LGLSGGLACFRYRWCFDVDLFQKEEVVMKRN